MVPSPHSGLPALSNTAMAATLDRIRLEPVLTTCRLWKTEWVGTTPDHEVVAAEPEGDEDDAEPDLDFESEVGFDSDPGLGLPFEPDSDLSFEPDSGLPFEPDSDLSFEPDSDFSFEPGSAPLLERLSLR